MAVRKKERCEEWEGIYRVSLLWPLYEWVRDAILSMAVVRVDGLDIFLP